MKAGLGFRLAALALLLVGSGSARAEEESDWEVYTWQSRPYLSMQNLKTVYGFKELESSGKAFELRSATAALKGRVGERSIFINGIRYDLHYSPILRNGRYMISAYDLTNLVDLLLRPGMHLHPEPLDTVYVQPLEEDQWSTDPSPRDIAYKLQSALGSYGLKVRFLSSDVMGIVGGGMSVEEDGSTLWLRLKGNGKLDHRHLRTTVLTPPGSPGRRSNESTSSREVHSVYFGNLHDAESIVIATLVQTGFLFGPGARSGLTADGGIGHSPELRAFQRSSGAAIQVEWGESVEADHLLKSIAAGVLRYRSFLATEVERARSVEESRKNLIEVSDVEFELDEEAGDLKLHVGLSRVRDVKVKPEEIEIQAFVFAREGDSAVDLIQAPPPRIRWEEDSADRLEVLYHVGHDDLGRIRSKSFGHVIRLVYQDETQDIVADPQGLRNQLWRFTATFPK